MRNLFKKSLAMCLAIALCLTAMVGLTVSAADATITGTITTSNVEVEAGATTADVSLTLAATDLSEVILSLAASEGATITGAAAPEGVTEYAVIPNSDYSMVAFSTLDVDTVTSEATVVVTVTFAEAVAEDAYTVTGTMYTGATNSEELIIVDAPAVANITVKAAEEECDHDWEVTSATVATGTGSSGDYATTETGTLVRECSLCEEKESNEVYYDERSRANSNIISLGSEISFTAIAKVTDLDRVGNLIDGSASSTTDEWSDFYCKLVVSTKTSGDVAVYYDMDSATYSDSTYTFTYGLAPFMLADDITVEFYTYNVDDERWYSGYVTVTSILAYIQKEIASADDTLKTLMVDLLSYGAAAQVKYGYDTENLLTNYLTIGGVDYSSYLTAGDASYVDDKVMASSSTEQYPVSFNTLNAVCSSKIYFDIGFQFGNNYYADYTTEYGDMYVVVKYKNLMGSEVAVTFYNAETNPNAQYTYTLSDGVRKFNFDFDVFNAGDMREKLYFEVYKGDGTLLNSETIYSVQSNVYKLYNDTTTDEATLNLLNEMLQFGDSARAFLSSTNA